MGIKIKYTDPTLNEFSTDDVVINVQSGSLFFKSNTKLFKLQGDDQSTTDVIEFSGLSGIIQDIDGNIGIGTTAPSSPLHVKGTVEISGSRYYTSGSSPPTLELMAIAATGSILPGVNSDGTTGFDLGSPTAVWRDLWLSQNSVRFVSSSGEVTRFRQEDAKALREGKPLKQATAVGGTDRFVRTQAIFHETADNHYIKQTEAGIWDFVGPGGNILNIDARESTHYVTMPSANSKLIIAGEISASGTITANSFVGSFTGAVTGDATGLTGVPDIIVGSLTATSITSSIVTSSVIYTEGSNIFGDELSDTHLFNGSITSSGNISSSGTITANNIISTINGGSF